MVKKGKKGRAARNAKKAQSGVDAENLYSKAPHSFVFHRGHVGKSIKELISETRRIMEPYTASRLKVRKKNVMKDFLTMAGPMNVSHFIVFTKTDAACYMRLVCVPRGPTLTFKINDYTLARDVLSFQKHPDMETKLFNNHAVMVTNIPADTMENKLMNVTFKNMFPSINPNTVQLSSMRRTVLVNYDKETKSVDLRHYTMKVVPTGISRAVKKLMKPKLPDMSKHADIADVFLDKGASDSEGEQDGPHSQVTVSQKIKDRGVARNATNAIRLKEVGPRLNLQLIKIEEGFEAGNVLYHAHISKTPEELEAQKQMNLNKKKEKLARKQRQEANVKKKKELKEKQIEKTKEGMKRKQLELEKSSAENGDDNPAANGNTNKDEIDSDDDASHYKREVGEEPEPEMFSRKRKQHTKRDEQSVPSKKKRNHNITDKKQSLQKSGRKNSKFSIKFSDKDKMGKYGKSKSDQKRGPRPSNLKSKSKSKRKR